MRAWWRQRFERWLAQRVPAAREVNLDHRRIFILPTRQGMAFLATLAVLFLGAVNYQNNLAFALVFLLLGLFLVSVLHTYANLAGLCLRGLRARPTYAGEPAAFELALEAPGRRERCAIELAWREEPPQSIDSVLAEAPVTLFRRSRHRGRLRPGRLRVSSRYPLGLLQAWSWVDLDLEALVYPRPLACPAPHSPAGSGERGSPRRGDDGDELHAFRPYRPGDPLRQVLWKAYARDGVLQTGLMARRSEPRVWLDFDGLEGGDAERRLCGLCHWVLQLSARGVPFGLRLPGVEVSPAAGEAQREAALRALALWRDGGAA